ncbi:MAG: TetR/AcrR family transcriptional regulator [Bacteroidota bacterium]
MPAPKLSREQLIDRCLLVFHRQGFHRTSMEDLARECGLQKGSFYYHFRSKEEILQEGLESVHNYFVERIFSLAHDTTETPQDRLENLLEACRKEFMDEERGCIMANMALETSSTVPAFTPIIQNFFNTWIDALTAILKTKYDDVEATALACKSVQQIEGSIMLMRIFKDHSHLMDALSQAYNLLDEAEES